jgi:hypothetical protein
MVASSGPFGFDVISYQLAGSCLLRKWTYEYSNQIENFQGTALSGRHFWIFSFNQMVGL